MNFVITKRNDYGNPFGLRLVKFGDFYFFHDDQWNVEDGKAYKGIPTNFCEIDFSVKDQISLRHNTQRDFPLWYDDDSCTNMSKLHNYLPADAELKYNNGWHVTYDSSWKDTNDYTMSRSVAIQLAKDVLIDNVSKFAQTNTMPVLAPDSDGLDTLLVRGVFDHLGVEYQLFDLKNRRSKLQRYLGIEYYGFVQVQDFDTPTCVLSGFYGDEYLLRSPSQTQMLIDDDLVELFDATEKSYMKGFFNQIYRDKCMKISKRPKSEVKEIMYNDIQVWHVDRTFVFTPFKDQRLLALLDCDQQTMISQQIHGDLSMELIEHFNPSLLGNLSEQKNSTEPYWFGP